MSTTTTKRSIIMTVQDIIDMLAPFDPGAEVLIASNTDFNNKFNYIDASHYRDPILSPDDETVILTLFKESD
jgi:hypothetical protein